jgi:hypothetical protein
MASQSTMILGQTLQLFYDSFFARGLLELTAAHAAEHGPKRVAREKFAICRAHRYNVKVRARGIDKQDAGRH